MFESLDGFSVPLLCKTAREEADGHQSDVQFGLQSVYKCGLQSEPDLMHKSVHKSSSDLIGKSVNLPDGINSGSCRSSSDAQSPNGFHHRYQRPNRRPFRLNVDEMNVNSEATSAPVNCPPSDPNEQLPSSDEKREVQINSSGGSDIQTSSNAEGNSRPPRPPGNPLSTLVPHGIRHNFGRLPSLVRLKEVPIYGEKTIGQWGSFVYLINQIFGAGILALPYVLKVSGWLPSFFANILVCLVAMFGTLMIMRCMTMVPGGFKKRISFCIFCCRCFFFASISYRKPKFREADGVHSYSRTFPRTSVSILDGIVFLSQHSGMTLLLAFPLFYLFTIFARLPPSH